MAPHNTSQFHVSGPDSERDGWSGATKIVRDLGDTVISVAISDDAKFFAAGGTNKCANIYAADNGALVATFQTPLMINALALRGKGRGVVRAPYFHLADYTPHKGNRR